MKIGGLYKAECLCVCLLLQLSRTHSLRSALRSDLFPSAEMILCLSREYGIPITIDDFTGNTIHLRCINFYTAVRHIVM